MSTTDGQGWRPIEDAPHNELVLLFSPVEMGQRIEVGF